jgi:hypothetical protein
VADGRARSYPRAIPEAWIAPACAGLTVTPTVTALTVSAAEMAMMVRFAEDPNMFQVPFWQSASSRGSCSILFMKRAKRSKLPFFELAAVANGR